MLFKTIRLLHQDISIGNLAFSVVKKTNEDGETVEIKVILLDFDLASIPKTRKRQASKLRTGTAPFMARDVLNAEREPYVHGLHHDLESLLYVAIWQSLGYRLYTPPEDCDPLVAWRKGDYKAILNAKRAFLLDKATQEPVLKISSLKSPYLHRTYLMLVQQYKNSSLDVLRSQLDISKEQEARTKAHVDKVVDEAKAKGLVGEELIEIRKLAYQAQKERLEVEEKTTPSNAHNALPYRVWLDSAFELDSDCPPDCKCSRPLTPDELAELDYEPDPNPNSS